MAILFVFWLISAVASALIFQSKHRSPAMGALLGFALGLIGVLIAACLSKRPAHNPEPFLLTRNTAVGPTAASMPPPPTAQTAPGWYPDPSDATKVRYWEGNGWTTYTDARQTAG